MTAYLGDYTNGKDNNFNLIRFIAAFLVLYSHSYAIATGDPATEPMRSSLGVTWGSIAVDIFFVTSGFLITRSYMARHEIGAFAWARFLRIYPGLWFVNLITVFGLGLIFTTYPITSYLTDIETWKYLIRNSIALLGIQYTLPGVFENNPYQYAINGSLWTLAYELKMYISVAIIILITHRIGKALNKELVRPVILIATTGAIAYSLHAILTGSEVSRFIYLFSYFFYGASLYIWRDKIPMTHLIGIPSTIVILASPLLSTDFFHISYSILLPYVIFYLAYMPGGKIREFNRFGDYSYGLYIYAFPVQQIVAATIKDVSIPVMIVVSFFFTLLCAIASWHFIEKKALGMKDIYKDILLAITKRKTVESK